MIKRFKELNEHYNGKKNQIYSNKVFTYKEAMTQEDAHLFVEAIQKAVADCELQNHGTIVHSSTAPRTAKPIQAIWSFKHK